MILMKLAVVAAYFAVGYALYKTYLYARMRYGNPSIIAVHRSSAKVTLWVTVGAVIITEVMVRMNGGVQDPALFWLHLSFAAPFLILLIVLQWLHGMRVPLPHKVLAYACIAAYVGTAATGAVLLVNA